MARAREAILSRGGAANVNVFTRFLLSFFEVLTWRSVPVLPVEIMLLPMWSPFHLNKISYWARTTMVPLMVLAVLKPRARNPRGVGIRELFLQDPATVRTPKRAPHQSPAWFALFSGLDWILREIEPLFPKWLRARAMKKAIGFVEERLNGEDGLGAIFPPMANTVMMYDALGYPPEHPTACGDATWHRQASGDQRGRGLLPALCIADLGYRAELPRAARSRRTRGPEQRRQKPRLAAPEAGARSSRATGR